MCSDAPLRLIKRMHGGVKAHETVIYASSRRSKRTTAFVPDPNETAGERGGNSLSTHDRLFFERVASEHSEVRNTRHCLETTRL